MGPQARLGDLDPFRTGGTSGIGGIAIEVCSAADPTPANLSPFDAVLVLGGDGTLNRHLPSFAQAAIPFLPVPTGSGNDFARGMGIGTRMAAELAWQRFVATRVTRPVDLGMVGFGDPRSPDDRAFCSVGGVGLSAEANRRANAMPAWLRGNGGYALAAVGSLPALAMPQVEVCANDDVLWSGRAAAVVFANTSAFGQGMQVAPRAHPGDGLLDLCIVPAMPRLRIAALLPSVFFGKHLGVRGVEYFQRARFVIRCDIPLPVYADGEFLGEATTFAAWVQPGKLRVIA